MMETCRFLYRLFVSVALVSGVLSDPDACPSCAPRLADHDALRLEAIKRQILSKLGLRAKPNVTSPMPREVVLETLYRAEEPGVESMVTQDNSNEHEDPQSDTEPDDFFGRTSEIIAFAEPGRTLNGQTLLEFSHAPETEGGAVVPELRVKAANLWVRVDFRPSLPRQLRRLLPDKNLTLWVFRVTQPSNVTHISGKEFDEYTEMAAFLQVSYSTLGWKKFDITSTVRSWYSSGDTERLRLLVDCSGCSDIIEVILFRGFTSSQRHPDSMQKADFLHYNGDPPDTNSADEYQSDSNRFSSSKFSKTLSQDVYRSFLVVHTDPSAMRRTRRRALDCSGALRGQCCKQRFYVSFKQLGWEDWIIAPGGYYANYCRGDCDGIHRTPDTFLNYYSHVIEEYRKMERLSGMQPCCTPLKFSSMSLIYYGPDSNIIKRDLPKMVVDECGCP